MTERTFSQLDPDEDARATEAAADLVERLLDQISRRNHDWTAIARDAATLARLTERMAGLG